MPPALNMAACAKNPSRMAETSMVPAEVCFILTPLGESPVLGMMAMGAFLSSCRNAA